MIRTFITLIILAVFVWLIWSFSGRNTPLQEPTSFISVVEEINPSDSLNRNIVGIQPFMEVSDYFNQVIFKEKIRQYLVAAHTQEFFQENTLIVYPEHIGTWLFLLGEKRSVAEKETIEEVINTIVISNAFDVFLGYLKTGEESNSIVSAIFRMKAKAMLKAYYETFSVLSIETNSHIVAGSIVLPEPRVVEGKIYLNLGGPLYNASFVFGPEGDVIGDPILKSFPDSIESSFTNSANPELSQVFDLPMGKTSVIICKDSWHRQSFENSINNGSEIILIPSFCTGEHSMNEKWLGDVDKKSLDNLDLNDIGELTNIEAWEKYGLPNHIKNTSATVGFNVFFRGDFWNVGSDGQPFAILNNSRLPITPSGKGGVWSLNF